MVRLAASRWLRLAAWVGALVISVAHGAASAQELADRALVDALREGGYAIYFRHAATDWSNEDRVESIGDWMSCDTNRMRQLSDSGRATARRIGAAIRALQIPIGRVLSSEYCRAAETARLMDLGPVQTTRNIMNMRAAELVGGSAAVIRRARGVLATPPPPGMNTIVVGHGNLLRAATDTYPDEGGGAVFVSRRNTEKGFALVARLSPEDWSNLAARFAGQK